MPTVDIPWIVSVDDHVIEPPSLWASRLPARYRDVGPRVERLPAGELALAGAQYVERPGTDGPLVDYWVYEDLYQSLKRARRRVRDVHREDMTMTATTYDDVRPGLLRPGGPRARHGRELDPGVPVRSRTSRGSAARPSSKRATASSRCSCVQAYNDWMVEEWCAGERRPARAAVPRAAVGPGARRGRGRTQRGARRARGVLLRDPRLSRAAEHPQRRVGSVLRRVRGDRHGAVPAHRLRRRRCRRRRPTRRSASR